MKRILVTTGFIVVFAALVLCVQLAASHQGPWPARAAPPYQLQGALLVTSRNDSGPGSLRQALLDAQPGDTITFDPGVFPPGSPATITLNTPLPELSQGSLTLDASDAGAILDGSAIVDPGANGLDVSSNENIIQGLQILNFPNAAVGLRGGAQDNAIGGDPGTGSGPLGQGNLLGGEGSFGVGLWDAGTSSNTITGNYIGTDLNGITASGLSRDGVHINGASHNQVTDNLISGNSQSGVYICCGAQNNIIDGNLIGTDATGLVALGNLESGVVVDQAAGANVIGPGNLIAHNGIHGVEVRTPDALGNTITRNSIHDNGESGIALWQGGGEEHPAPLVLDFDFPAGTLAGTTCANCTVEVFADDRDEGERYEGQAVADGMGTFHFAKGAAFTGPNLTATATEPTGTTSEFSYPVSGTQRSLVLQEGNSLPRTLFRAQSAGNLADNRIGDQLSLRGSISTTQEATAHVETHNRLGLKWKRLSLDYLDWSDVQATGAYSRYYVDPVHDQLITDLADMGVTIVYCLVFWDEEIEPVPVGYARFKTEEEIQRYLDYARFIVGHFKDRIQYYEILNESFFGEGSDFTQQNIELADYVNLVRRAAPVIHEEYPEARVIAGPAPALYEQACYDYELGILASDVMTRVQGVSWHPGPYPVELGGSITHLYQVPETIHEITSTASAHGFAGEYIPEEIQWPTAYNPSPSEPWNVYSETVSAKYYARGILDHLGMETTALLAGTAYEGNLPKMDVIRNLSTLMARAEPISVPVEIEGGGVALKQYSFALPDGGYLLALWRDEPAVEEMVAGTPLTLTLPGLADYHVMGVDVLFSFQQTLLAEMEEEALVIRDLLVRDYPLLLHITPRRSIFLPLVLRNSTPGR